MDSVLKNMGKRIIEKEWNKQSQAGKWEIIGGAEQQLEWINETTLKMESEADQRTGLVEGDNEDWGDDHLELMTKDENVAEEEENDRDKTSDEETLKDIVGFRSLSSLFLYHNTWSKWDQS